MSDSGGIKTRVGILGYGKLGKFMVNAILHDPAVSKDISLAFVWNRSLSRLNDATDIPKECICTDLSKVAGFDTDLIVEVSHPDVVKRCGAIALQKCHLLVGSPTAFADKELEAVLRKTAADNNHTIFVPAGALWGGQDIQKLNDRKGLSALKITMKKHPSSLKLHGDAKVKLDAYKAEGDGGECVLFDGSIRDLCPMAPNNVNTIAAAAMAADTLGFDGVQARLVCDQALQSHDIIIDVTGMPQPDGSALRISTTRVNPAPPGAVTGSATYGSFVSAMLRAAALRSTGGVVQLC